MKPTLAPTKTHWMIVDDNADILRMMSAVLKRVTGAVVEIFDSPRAALTAFDSAPEKYALVITDFQMPEMDGVELCRRMRAQVPAQKIFLATGSGFFTEAAARRAHPLRFRVVAKPTSMRSCEQVGEIQSDN